MHPGMKRKELWDKMPSQEISSSNDSYRHPSSTRSRGGRPWHIHPGLGTSTPCTTAAALPSPMEPNFWSNPRRRAIHNPTFCLLLKHKRHQTPSSSWFELLGNGIDQRSPQWLFRFGSRGRLKTNAVQQELSILIHIESVSIVPVQEDSFLRDA